MRLPRGARNDIFIFIYLSIMRCVLVEYFAGLRIDDDKGPYFWMTAAKGLDLLCAHDHERGGKRIRYSRGGMRNPCSQMAFGRFDGSGINDVLALDLNA